MLKLDSDTLGRRIVGDVIDAYTGHQARELERTRVLASLIRNSTSIMVNLQLKSQDRVTPHELWPLPWDDEDVSGEDYAQSIKAITAINELKGRDGNCNK